MPEKHVFKVFESEFQRFMDAGGFEQPGHGEDDTDHTQARRCQPPPSDLHALLVAFASSLTPEQLRVLDQIARQQNERAVDPPRREWRGPHSYTADDLARACAVLPPGTFPAREFYRVAQVITGDKTCGQSLQLALVRAGLVDVLKATTRHGWRYRISNGGDRWQNR